MRMKYIENDVQDLIHNLPKYPIDKTNQFQTPEQQEGRPSRPGYGHRVQNEYHCDSL